MLTSCSDCDHKLWSEVRATGSFRFLAHFDDEENDSTYAEHASTLHHHFEAMTNMSPLQYQKRLRLQEARRLIPGSSLDAATAGFSVGYNSPSQFSREYGRLFGAPPLRDTERLKSEHPQEAPRRTPV